MDAGRWTVECGPAGAAFLHELAHPAGYSYRYRKCLRLVQDSPELRIEHSLNNTGTRAIDVWQYYHNFFLIDGRVSGPGLTVLFRFPPLHSSALDGAVRVRGDAIEYTRELAKGESVLCEIEGFEPIVEHYDISVEDSRIGVGARIRGDRPLSKLVFWSNRRTVCPEPYVALRVPPGARESWMVVYSFYDLADRQRQVP